VGKYSAYYNNLIKRVIDNSNASTWEKAVLEWEMYDCEEDTELASSCLCGKEDLRYLFTIRNSQNGNMLYPIGSSCIKKFNRSDLNESVSIKEQLFKLLHAIKSNEFITLSNKLFSRKLLAYLYESGAFKPSPYNRYDPEEDYEFMLMMFNKRDKGSVSEAQNRKVRAIIMSSIRPYLQHVLHDRAACSLV